MENASASSATLNCLPTNKQSQQSDTDSINKLLAAFAELDLSLNAEETNVPIAILPDELLAEICKRLVTTNNGVVDVGNFGLVARRTFLVSRNASVWKHLCRYVYRHHEISLGIEYARRVEREQLLLYKSDWRLMYMLRPRLRFDGAYISRCHYLRSGLAESSFYTPVHLVAYFRYLRFYCDGTCVKLLSTEEPSKVVPLLNRKPDMDFFATAKKLKGAYFQGTYILQPPSLDVHAGNPKDHRLDIRLRSREQPRRVFRMTLNLKSTSRGKWNKLSWQEYLSRGVLMDGAINDGEEHGIVDDIWKATTTTTTTTKQVKGGMLLLGEDVVEDEENETQYELTQMKSFFFSKVKSYQM